MGHSLIIDCETGGIELRRPIIQIAAIAVDDTTLDEVDALEVKVRFDPKVCDPEALAINHYDEKVWQVEAVDHEVARDRFGCFVAKFQEWNLISKKGRPYSTARVIGHNVQFDLNRLRSEFWHRAFTPFAWWYPFDSMQLALWYFWTHPEVKEPANYQLGTLCECFGIKVYDSHDALVDCRLTADLVGVLTGRPNRRKGSTGGR